MNLTTVTSPDEPVFDHEEAGLFTDDDSLVCAEECFLTYDREKAAQENTLLQ